MSFGGCAGLSPTPRQRAAPAVGDKPDDIGDPVPVSAQAQQRGIAAAQRSGHLGAVSGSGFGEVVAQLLGELPESDQLPGFAADRRAATARQFIELIVLPVMMRALFGEDLAALRDEIEPYVARTVAFFLAACRHRGVE